MTLLDREGRIGFISLSATRVLGVAPRALRGRLYLEAVHEEDRPRFQELLERCLATPPAGPVRAEIRSAHASGELRTLEVVLANRLDVPGLEAIICNASDVTERKRAEEALRRSEASFRGLVESAPDATIIARKGGAIVLVNARAEALFGYTRAELCGSPIELVVPERHGAAHEEHRRRYLADAIPRDMGEGLPLHARRKDGTEFPVEISLSTLETPDGTLVSAAVRDISERKRLQAQLLTLRAHGLGRDAGRRRGPRDQQPARRDRRRTSTSRPAPRRRAPPARGPPAPRSVSCRRSIESAREASERVRRDRARPQDLLALRGRPTRAA